MASPKRPQKDPKQVKPVRKDTPEAEDRRKAAKAGYSKGGMPYRTSKKK